MPPTSIISSKNPLAVFEQSKRSFSRFFVKEDFNKGQTTQVSTKFEDGFFQ